jgi:NAD-dependent oxidoreductase involved in siderophore biosynthesis
MMINCDFVQLASLSTRTLPSALLHRLAPRRSLDSSVTLKQKHTLVIAQLWVLQYIVWRHGQCVPLNFKHATKTLRNGC